MLKHGELTSERLRNCGTWWRGNTERERFILYYSCLRYHYGMPAVEAINTARMNWHNFGPSGDVIANLRAAIRRAKS